MMEKLFQASSRDPWSEGAQAGAAIGLELFPPAPPWSVVLAPRQLQELKSNLGKEKIWRAGLHGQGAGGDAVLLLFN